MAQNLIDIALSESTAERRLAAVLALPTAEERITGVQSLPTSEERVAGVRALTIDERLEALSTLQPIADKLLAIEQLKDDNPAGFPNPNEMESDEDIAADYALYQWEQGGPPPGPEHWPYLGYLAEEAEMAWRAAQKLR